VLIILEGGIKVLQDQQQWEEPSTQKQKSLMKKEQQASWHQKRLGVN